MAVKADVGMMGGSLAHEFMYLSPVGEDTIMFCDECGLTANRQVTQFRKPQAEAEDEMPMEKVATPEMKTIEELAGFLEIPKAKTAKAVFLVATIMDGRDEVEKFVFAVVRGDMEVNETKLANAVRAKDLRPALEEEIISAGAVPGYASPIGLKDVLVVVDDAIPSSPNLVSGANEDGFHCLNVNFERDYKAAIVTDIALAQDGNACPACGIALRSERGVEVGNIFKLGTRYSDAVGCTFVDQDGQTKPVIMGSYGIGSGRLMACIAEEYRDEHGLMWPVTVAPYQVHLVALSGQQEAANLVYLQLVEAGIEVLFDDRDESPGVKFNDADLIGIPVRLTVSKRSVSRGGVEMKLRHLPDRGVIPQEDVVDTVKNSLAKLEAAITSSVVQEPYETLGGA